MKRVPPSILVAEDLGLDADRWARSRAVKTCAAKLARRLGVPIDLVHVEDLGFYPAKDPEIRPILESHLEEQEARLDRAARHLKVPTRSTFLLAGDPAAKIVSLASRRGRHELCAVGTQGRTGLKRLIVGSVAEEVIRNSPIPVLTVPPGARKASRTFLDERAPRLLVPTGLTPNSERAEAYAYSLASRIGAEIHYFHSLHDALHPVLQTALGVPSGVRELTGLLGRLRKDAGRILERKARETTRRGVRATCSVDASDTPAADATLRCARELPATLIVMGTHGRSTVTGAFFGRTARGVILGAAVPVVTVRSRRS